MTKRIISIIISVVLVLALLTACGESKPNTSVTPETAKSSEATPTPSVEPSGKVMIYSSMQEPQLQALKEGFNKKYPKITFEYYFAGTGKVVTKINTEKQAGQVAADVLWVGDPSDYINFKEQGILEKYESKEAATIDKAFMDAEGYYCGARLVVVGFGYNTNLVKPEEAPKKWEDLLDPKWKDQIIMTDPGSSGTSKYAAGALMANSKYGLDYFTKLKANGALLESGTTATHNKLAAGAYKVGICLDYVTLNLAKEGSTIAFAYPESDLISITSPIAIVKNSANQENGKLLYDFILSKEGQEILVANSLTSVRNDLPPQGKSLPEIAKQSMKVDDTYLAKNNILEAFDKIYK